MRDGADISVVVLTYNHGHVLGPVVDSILAQTVRGVEVVVSDDRSTDGTWDVVQEIARRHPAVRTVRPERNLGMAGNANFAVAQTGRPLVALLHHDDLCRPDLLARWAAVVDHHPDVAFVSNGVAYTAREQTSVSPFAECTNGADILGVLLSRWPCPFRGTAMVRRSAWDAVGGMDERFGMLADIDLWMRLAAHGAVGYVAEPLLTVHHERPADYPEAYSAFSWDRRRTLYEIHAANVERRDGRGSAAWHRCRWRVTKDVLTWLGYAVARRQPAMLASADRGRTPFEWPGVHAARRTAARASRVVLPHSSAA